MSDSLLETARQQAEQADLPVRAAALLRIARAEFAPDGSRARTTLLEGLDALRMLKGSIRDYLLSEARMVAAAVSPELVAKIPVDKRRESGRFASLCSTQIIQTMLSYGHADAAFDYLLGYDDPEAFPFFSVGSVLHRLDAQAPEHLARRTLLLNHALEVWRHSLSTSRMDVRSLHLGHHRGFVGLFARFWKDLPPEEALSIARTIVDRAAGEPDEGVSAGYADTIRFTSPRQNTLFQILHVLRHLEPALAESLTHSNHQLATAARRYPYGIETMHEEAEAEAKRREVEGAACQEGTCGYLLTGDPGDFDRQRCIIDAARNGDFAPSIEDALNKYREDTSPETQNYAPKVFWPSTGAFRSVLHQAGRHIGSDAAKLLEQIPDDDLRLFASIELAAALSGVPASSITSMKQSRPPDTHQSQGRIVAATCTSGEKAEPHLPAMRSPDGRLIHCPKCLFQPTDELRWNCKCGHVWNTFRTAGECPACHFQWELTMCPRCGEMSEHRDWYRAES